MLKHRNSLQKSLCPVVIRLDLCTSDKSWIQARKSAARKEPGRTPGARGPALPAAARRQQRGGQREVAGVAQGRGWVRTRLPWQHVEEPARHAGTRRRIARQLAKDTKPFGAYLRTGSHVLESIRVARLLLLLLLLLLIITSTTTHYYYYYY